MSTPEDCGQNNPSNSLSFPYGLPELFDTSQEPHIPEQIDDAPQLITNSNAYRVGPVEPEVAAAFVGYAGDSLPQDNFQDGLESDWTFFATSDATSMLTTPAPNTQVFPNAQYGGQAESGNMLSFVDYNTNSTMTQEPTGEINDLSQPANFQGEIAEMMSISGLESDWAFNATPDPTMTTLTAFPLNIEALAEYPPLPAVGEEVHRPFIPQGDTLYPTIEPAMLLHTSATVQPQPMGEVNSSMAFQSMTPHEVPHPDYGLNAPLVPSLRSGAVTPIQTSGGQAPMSVLVPEDPNRILTQVDRSTLVGTASTSLEPTSASSSTGKRKAFGPSKDICLPPLKRRVRCGPMPQEKRIERAVMRKAGACIICRQEKKKCDNDAPCGTCRKKFELGIKKNPCTKAHFLDIVECKPCYPCSVLYESMFLEGLDNRSLLKFLSTFWELRRHGWAALQIAADVPFSVSVLSPLSQIPDLLHLDPRVGSAPKRGTQLPRLCSTLPESLAMLTKKYSKCKPGSTFCFTQTGSAPEGMKTDMQLYFSAAVRYEFTLIHRTGTWTNIVDGSLYEYARLLLWVTTRQCEIFLFRYLQSSANQMGTMSPTDLGRTIMHLLKAIWLLSSRLENTVLGAPTLVDRGPDKEATLSQEIVRQIEDRRKRFDFWTQLEKSPFKLPQQAFKKLLTDLDSFDYVLEAKHGEIHVHFLDEPLSDTPPSSSAEIRISQFPLISRFDWERVSSAPHDLGMSVLASVLYRLESITMLEHVKHLYETHAIPASKVKTIFSRLMPEIGQRGRKGSLLSLRGDLRWIELRELAGEEIFLLEHPNHRWLHINDGIQPLNVPLIVLNGSEAEFHRLKVLLTTSHSWIVQCCRQLKGTILLLRKSLEALSTGKYGAQSLASQIKERIRDVFGSRKFIHDVVYSQPIASSESSTATTFSKNSNIQEEKAHEAAKQREAVDSNDSGRQGAEEDLKEDLGEVSEDELDDLLNSTMMAVDKFLER